MRFIEHFARPTPRSLRLRVAVAVIVIVVVGGAAAVWWPPGQEAYARLRTWEGDRTSYDVIVVGSEPEGVVTAVAAAQEGASTLLVTTDERIGGLFVTGMMNSLDLRTAPELYQRGLFEQWWDRVGRRGSFDVSRAEEAFENMLATARVTVMTADRAPTPEKRGSEVFGLRVGDTVFVASQIVDATADGDFMAAAGAPFTVGFASIGFEERMADTLVFRIDGIDWDALAAGIRSRGGPGYASIDEYVAWGHFGGYPAAYEAQESGIRLRGLNLGRQEDGSVLVNALLIYGIDPFDPESMADGAARATREAPRIVAYLRHDLPGFENARYAGVAESLYIRESRHLSALCRLTVDEVLHNLVTEHDVAAGGYPLDVQTLTPSDNGYVFGVPEIYGVRLCVTVPRGVDGLWVVGKTAGYDPLAASSARVVPFGMALAEAVGIAAARSAERGLSPSEFVSDTSEILRLREGLELRGAYLPDVEQREPVGPYRHPHYGSYRTLSRWGLAVGGYANDPKLDEEMSAVGYLYLLSNIGKRILGDDSLGRHLLATFPDATGRLTADLALRMTAEALCERTSQACGKPSWAALREHGIAPADFPVEGVLTRGEMYALGARLAIVGPPSMSGPGEPGDYN